MLATGLIVPRRPHPRRSRLTRAALASFPDVVHAILSEIIYSDCAPVYSIYRMWKATDYRRTRKPLIDFLHVIPHCVRCNCI